MADSVPETEEQETRNKAAALLAAVPAARAMRQSEDRSDQEGDARTQRAGHPAQVTGA